MSWIAGPIGGIGGLGGPGDLTTATPGVIITGGTGATANSGAVVDIQAASGSQPGLLSAADWATFNSKQSAITGTANGDIAYYNGSAWVALAAASGKFLRSNGLAAPSWEEPTAGLTIGTTPITGGATTQVLYNLSGAVQSDAAFTADPAGGGLVVGPVGSIAYNTHGTFEFRRAAGIGLYAISATTGPVYLGAATPNGNWDFVMASGASPSWTLRSGSSHVAKWNHVTGYLNLSDNASVTTAVSRLHLSETAAAALNLRLTNLSTGHTAGDGTSLGIDTAGKCIFNQNEALDVEFQNAGVKVGSYSSAGVWTLGPSGGGVTHKINSNVVAAGASTATLLTAPVAGEPATWLKININGTDMLIPAWTAP